MTFVMSPASSSRSMAARSVMSPVSNRTVASSSGVMICWSRRVSVPRSSAMTGTPSRASWRTVHAPMHPRAPVTRNRSPDAADAVIPLPWRSVFCPLDRGLDDTLPSERTSTTHHPSDMTVDHAARVTIGQTGLEVTRLGFGGASIGGLFEAVADEAAVDTIKHAWEVGVRYFDTAPLYGYGASERRFGMALADRPRDAFVLSTKLGRLVRDRSAIPPGADVDRQQLAGRDDAFYVVADPLGIVFDFSADGVRRSIEESLERLRLERIDIALIHDPDDHWRDAIDGAWPALERLRSEGVIGAVGAGMNQSAMLTRFVRETTMDAVLLAGRYTLLEQGALADLLPACLER